MTDTTGVPESTPTTKGFWAALFDLKFEEWVTLRVAGVLYILVLALIGLFGVISFFSLLFDGGFSIVIALVGVPIGLFLALLITRLSFEATIALVAIARNTESMKNS